MVKLARKVLKNSIFNSLRALIGGIGGFVFSVVLARLLTPEQYGIYALTMSICFFVMQFDPGTSYTMIRYVSYSIGKRDFKSARAYFYFLLKIRVLFLLVSSTLLFLLAKVLAYNVFNKPELFVPLQIAAFLLFAIHFSGYFDDLCFAFQNFKYPAIKQLIYEISRFTFVIPFLLMGFSTGYL